MNNSRIGIVALVFAVWLVVPDLAVASGTPVEQFSMPNGLIILVVKKPQLPIIDGVLAIKTGALGDPSGKEGLATIIAEMLVRGTAGRTADQISDALDDTGGTVSTVIDWDRSQVSFHVLKSQFPSMVALVADLVQHPSFPAAELQAEKDLVLDRIRGRENDNISYSERLFYEELYAGSRYGLDREGTESSIAAITPADVAAFHRANYVPPNAVLILVGNVSEVEVDAAKVTLGGWKGARPPAIAVHVSTVALKGNVIRYVNKPEMSQCQIRLGHAGIARDHPDYFSTLVLNSILGGGFSSRLMDELRRKRALTYGVSSDFQYGKTAGPFHIWTFTPNEKAGEVIRLILQELRKAETEGMTDAEVNGAKQYLIGTDASMMESPTAITDRLLEIEVNDLPIDSFQKYTDDIKKVTREDVHRVAAKYLDPDNNLILILGQRPDIEPQLRGAGVVASPVSMR
jgi:zinc protease